MFKQSLISPEVACWPVLIAEQLPDEAMLAFRRSFPQVRVLSPEDQNVDGIIRNASGMRAVVTTVRYKLDDRFFAALPETVEIVALYSSGYDHVDLEAAKARGISVINTPNILADSVADLAMLLLLGAARRVVEGVDLIRSGKWAGSSPGLLLGKELRGQVLGIYGLGRIGREVSIRAQAFGMNVTYRNRFQLPREIEAGARFVGSDHDFLGGCDALLLAAASTPQTRRFLNAERIAWLKPGAIVVNISRGELVEDEALIAGLLSGHIGAVGLDVFDNEPAFDKRYLTTRGVFMLPHIGGATVEARSAMADLLVDGIEMTIQGEVAANRLA